MKYIAILSTALLFNVFNFSYADILKIELPEKYYGATPLDYFGANYEEPIYKKRPPFEVPEGTTNLARGKKVHSSVEKPEYGKFELLTDGDKHFEDESLLGLAKGIQWIQIDLEQHSELYALTLWHFHKGDRVYFDVIIRVADDKAFTKNVRDVFNNDHDNSSKLGVGKDKEYLEMHDAHFVNLKKVKARYIRFYSAGNTDNEFNHYVEAEVFGKPLK